MDSFFLYRLPEENKFTGGIGNVVTGIGYGFIISSFYNREEATLTIVRQEDFSLESLRNINDIKLTDSNSHPIFPFPDQSTIKEDYINDVSEIRSVLRENEKTVYCKTICGEDSIDLYKTLISLDRAFPEAMVYCFHTPQTGTWIGASPEKLLSNKNGILSTMALAGTRKVSETDEWDEKNIGEQRLVTDYISTILEENGLDFSYDPHPSTRKVGKLEHLCTNFHADYHKSFGTERLKRFLYDLSPTPALCGYPKEKSYATIREKERFSRAFYGGFMGPREKDGDFSFYVILRSVSISDTHWCMYAGGGITPFSIPEKEWEETESKAASILEKLIFKR